MNLILIAAGGATGALLRFLFVGASMRLFGSSFPYGTLGVNIVGSFLMGAAAFAVLRGELLSSYEPFRLFMMTGLLGGFTTFSAFSLDTINLIEAGRVGDAMLYIVGSVTLSIFALVLGMMCVRAVQG